MTPTVRLTLEVPAGSADTAGSVAAKVVQALRNQGIQAEVIVAGTPTVSIAYLAPPPDEAA